MRAGLLITVVAAVVFGTASVGSASVFPDLPGMNAVEKVTAGKGPLASSSTSSGGGTSSSKTDRVPAPDSKKTTSALSASIAPSQLKTITDLPGGGMLPLSGQTTSNGNGFPVTLALLAVAVTVLFTRFLVRLNTLGPKA